MDRYMRRNLYVDAVQWTGQNLAVIVQFVEVSLLEHDREEGTLILQPVRHGRVRLNTGDWLVLHDDQAGPLRLEIMPDATFTAMFEQTSSAPPRQARG